MDWDEEIELMRTCITKLGTMKHYTGLSDVSYGHQRSPEWLEMADKLEAAYELIPYPRIEDLVNTFRDGAGWINDPNYKPDPQRQEKILELWQNLRQWADKQYSRPE